MAAPRISEAEWEVMEVVWRRHPITSAEIVVALSGEKKWAANTVRTMLARLVRKKVLWVEAEGKTYRYRPALSHAECVRQAGQSFLDRVFDGAAGSLLLHFAKANPLTRRELIELDNVLRKRKKGK